MDFSAKCAPDSAADSQREAEPDSVCAVEYIFQGFSLGI